MSSWSGGMSSLAIEAQEARARRVELNEETLTVELVDGRVISVPLGWYPRLWYGTPEERAHVKITGDGGILHWPELDEDLSVRGILAGRRSGETPESLKRWLAARGRHRSERVTNFQVREICLTPRSKRQMGLGPVWKG